MSVKAVYASKMLAIYISQTELDDLLRGNIVLGPVIAADETLAPEGVDVRLTVPGIQALRIIQNAEEVIHDVGLEETWEEFVKRVSGKMFP